MFTYLVVWGLVVFRLFCWDVPSLRSHVCELCWVWWRDVFCLLSRQSSQIRTMCRLWVWRDLPRSLSLYPRHLSHLSQIWPFPSPNRLDLHLRPRLARSWALVVETSSTQTPSSSNSRVCRYPPRRRQRQMGMGPRMENARRRRVVLRPPTLDAGN